MTDVMTLTQSVGALPKRALEQALGLDSPAVAAAA
jgi:hypothetical protein